MAFVRIQFVVPIEILEQVHLSNNISHLYPGRLCWKSMFSLVYIKQL
jgi:hypothetical protein